MHKILAFFIVLTTLSLSASFETNDTWEQARQLYYQGLKEEDSLSKAMELFEQLSGQSNEPGVAETYLGSLTAHKAKYTP